MEVIESPTVEETPTLPEEAIVNPFEDNTTSPFEGIEAPGVTTEPAATPIRTQIAAVAQLSEAEDTTSESSTYRALMSATETARALLDTQQERLLRYESAGRSMREVSKSIKKLGSDAMVSPELLAEIEKSANAEIAADIDRRAKTALESEAFNNIRELLSAGNETEARIMMRQFEPDKNSTLGVIRDHAEKRMVLAQEIERLEGEEAKESWLHTIISGIISVPAVILGGENFMRTGIIPEGTGGYEGSWFKWLAPGSDMRKTIEAVQGMSASELKEYLPTLRESIRENSELFLEDPGIQLQLTREISEGLTDFDVLQHNAFGMADALGLAPLGLAKKALTVPFMLQSAGSRSAAAKSVSNAYELMIKEGAESAQSKTGIGIDVVEDNMLPSAINPHKTGMVDDTGHPLAGPDVSLSGDVNDGLEAAEQAIRSLDLASTNRFVNQGELDEAVENAVARMKERLGTTLKDFEVQTVKLPDATSTFKIVATIGKNEGGGFATYEEAIGFAQSRGLMTNNGSVITRELEEATGSILRHEDEGYTIPGYHGSKGVFESFDDAFLGETTKAGSAKIAHFFASPKGAYAGGIKVNDAAREAAQKELDEMQYGDNDPLIIAMHADEGIFHGEIPPEADKFLEVVNNGLVQLNAFGRASLTERTKRMSELNNIIRVNTPGKAEDASNIAWSYARMATDPNDPYKVVEDAEAAIDDAYRRRQEISDRIEEEMRLENPNIDFSSKTAYFDLLRRSNDNPEYVKISAEIDNLSKKLQDEHENYNKIKKAEEDALPSNQIVKPLKERKQQIDDEIETLYRDMSVPNAELRVEDLRLERAQIQLKISTAQLGNFVKNPDEMVGWVTKEFDERRNSWNPNEKLARDRQYYEDLSGDIDMVRYAAEAGTKFDLEDLAYRTGKTEDEIKAVLTKAPFPKKNLGGIVYPVRIKGNNLKVVEGDRSVYEEVVYREELKKAQEEGYDGVVFKDAHDPGSIDPDLPSPPRGSYDVIALFDPQNVRMALSPGKVIKDVSQQHFVKAEFDVPETGFYATALAPPKQSFLSKFWKTISQTSDRRLFEQAVRSGQKRNRLYKIIEQNMTKTFRSLNKKERTWVEQILAESDKRSVWFNDDEFRILYERSAGEWPGEKVLNAYKQYRTNNDMEFILRDADVYRQKVIRGFESAKFATFGDQHDLDVIVDWTPDRVPTKARIYNLSDDVHYTTSDIHGSVGNLTNERLRELRDRGYVMFKSEKAIELKDGTTVDWFLGKRDDIQLRPLRRRQLAYKAGGHRLYADKYFVKQAAKGVQADTGKTFLKNPNVWITAPTIKNARDWASTMNAARLAIKEGESAQYLDENIFKGDIAYPKGEEFANDIEAGKIDIDEEFEAVFDREMPSAYSRNEDVSSFMDEDEVGFNGFYRTTGKMYYSPKGEMLKDYSGQYAPTIDPFEAQAKALNNVSQLSSFSDFKTSAIDRWVRTYKRNLNVRDLPTDQASSPASIFNSATVARDTPVSLRQQIEGQRESIKRILGFESEWDRGYRNFMRSTSEWIVGDSDNALRQWASKGVYWLQDKNPVGFLRGLAFDMKLGMFNVGQFFIQTSTMASALAMSPKYGMQGMASIMPIRAYIFSKSNENVLQTLTERGVHKLSGFDDADEFKQYVRDLTRSGFLDLSDTHVLVNNIGPANTFGSLKGGASAVMEAGRFFFYEAELFNRITAHRIAYGEALERFGKKGPANRFEFDDFVSGRAENYSFNMSNESKAAWQTGILSIPTQFWAYNVRMIEALVGNNFTNSQKLRLAAMQMGLAGTAGIPIVAGLSQYVQQKHGVKPEIDTMLGTVERGVADRLIYELFGADIEISEKWGTGSWSSDLVKDIFGMSEYNTKSFADLTLGATGGIAGQTLAAATDIAKYWMTHESGSEEVDLTSDQWLKLFKQISTVNNAIKAMMVHEYGVYLSTKGSVLASGLPSEDAAFIAMGIPPAELDEIGVMMAYNKNRKEHTKELATQINNYLQEGVAVPSKFEENAKKVNALVNMIPPELKQDVMRQVHQTRDPSLYSNLIRRRQEMQVKEDQLKGTTE